MWYHLRVPSPSLPLPAPSGVAGGRGGLRALGTGHLGVGGCAGTGAPAAPRTCSPGPAGGKWGRGSRSWWRLPRASARHSGLGHAVVPAVVPAVELLAPAALRPAGCCWGQNTS